MIRANPQSAAAREELDAARAAEQRARQTGRPSLVGPAMPNPREPRNGAGRAYLDSRNAAQAAPDQDPRLRSDLDRPAHGPAQRTCQLLKLIGRIKSGNQAATDKPCGRTVDAKASRHRFGPVDPVERFRAV